MVVYEEKNPQYEKEISRLVANGQMHFSFSGNNIIDTNLVQGESIVRNLLNGYQYLKNKYNYHCESADRMDAFCNAAQLPQICRGFGSKWVKHISYVPCETPYWEGIDGSCVYNMNSDRIFFSSDVQWATTNHRLRIVFPSAANGKHMYEVPYAYIVHIGRNR